MILGRKRIIELDNKIMELTNFCMRNRKNKIEEKQAETKRPAGDTKWMNTHHGSPRRRQREYLNKRTENFWNLMGGMNINIQAAQ